MDIYTLIGYILAAGVGITLGLFGGGGSILTVPILTYLMGIDAPEAIAASLIIVGITSAVSLIAHQRAKQVLWKIGLIFGVAGMMGAFFGGLLGGYLPAPVLMLLLAVMMVTTAIFMIRKRPIKAGDRLENTIDQHGEPLHTELPYIRIIIDGVLVGFATGIVGAGGGFLIVPALTLLAGIPMAQAVGTSLLIIVMKSVAGAGGYLLTVQIDWPLVAIFSSIAIIGAFFGSRLAHRISDTKLRVGFGYFVVAVGILIAVQETFRILQS